MLVQPAPPEHYTWLAEHAGCGITQDFRALEVVRQERILGMVGYCDWAPNSARLHVAVESPWVIKYLLGPGFSYPFQEVGVGLLIGITPANAVKAVKFNRHLGFREAHRIPDGWGVGVDLIVFEMRREECRWLRPKLPTLQPVDDDLRSSQPGARTNEYAKENGRNRHTGAT